MMVLAMVRHSVFKGSLFFLLAGVSFFVFTVPGSCEDPYIINGDFEKRGFFTRAPKGWKTWVRKVHETEVTFDVDSRIAYHGARSVRIINHGYGDCCYCLQKTIPVCVEENALYQISGYIRCRDVEGTATIKVLTVDADDHKDWGAALATSAGNHEWRCITERFAVASAVEKLGLQLELVGPGTAWFDQIHLRRIEEDSLSTITFGEKSFIEIPFMASHEQPQVVQVQDRGDYIISQAPNPGDIVPDAVPLRQEISSVFEVNVARDEYEPISFNVYALKNLQSVRIQVADLVGSQGQRIFADAIDVRTVRYWPQRLSWNSGNYHVIPELLEHREAIDIPTGTSQQFWLTLLVPPEADPGIYHSTVHITARNADSVDLTLNVQVWPFELKKPPDVVWGLYADNRRWERYTTEQIRAELEDIRSHGINSLLLTPLSVDRIAWGPEGVEIDLSRINTYMRALQDIGFQGPIVFSIQNLDDILLRILQERGIENAFMEEYKKVIEKLIMSAEKNEWPRIWYLAVDEPGNSEEKRQQALQLYRLLKELGCGTVTTADVVFSGQVLDPWLDVRCYDLTYVGKTAEQCAKRRAETAAAGDVFWWYGSGCYPGQEGRVSANRYLTGFLFWKTGAGGQWSWTYQRPYGDPYNDFDGTGKDACITYPAESGGGSIPTLQWEGIREGIDDARYVYTLEMMIQEGLRSSDERTRERAADAEQRLNGLMDAVPWLYDAEFTNADANVLRLKIAQMILELSS